MLGHPFGADLLGSDLGVLSLVEGLELGSIDFVDAVAPSSGLAVGKGGVFARGRVSIVADEVHRLVISENDDHLAALAQSLTLQLLEVADDLEGVRPPI